MLSPVTAWQAHCSRCGAELAPDATTCAHCGQATERMLPRDSVPGLFQLPRVNHAAVAVLVAAAMFGTLDAVPRMIHLAGVLFALAMGVISAYLARPSNGLGVALKFATIVLCAIACVFVPTDGMRFLLVSGLLFGVVMIACCVGAAGFFTFSLQRVRRESTEETR